jgi:hypothetical protein
MTNNLYRAIKDRHQEEFNAFSKKFIFYAFDKNGFNEGMKKINLDWNNESDLQKIVAIGAGGFILKLKVDEFNGIFDRFTSEKKQAADHPESGEQFIYDMFHYELGNHEYGYTWDETDAIRASIYTPSQIQNDPKLLKLLNQAKKAQREWYALHG